MKLPRILRRYFHELKNYFISITLAIIFFTLTVGVMNVTYSAYDGVKAKVIKYLEKRKDNAPGKGKKPVAQFSLVA